MKQSAVALRAGVRQPWRQRGLTGSGTAMGVSAFAIPSSAPDEVARERAVLKTGVLTAINNGLLTAIALEARREVHTAMAAVSIVYADWQYLVATAGLPSGPYSRRTSFCAHAILSKDSIFYVPDAESDGRFADNPSVTDGLLRFYAGAVLRDEEGLALGALCVFDPKPRGVLDLQQRSKLRALGDRAEKVIQQLN
jgi:GAF domain-containing protein